MAENREVFKDLQKVIGDGSGYAIIYYPKEKKIERAYLSIIRNAKLSIDHLPQKGYSVTSYDRDDYGLELKVFDCDVLPYSLVLFSESDTMHTVFFLNSGRACNVKVSVKSTELGMHFEIIFEDGGNMEQFSCEDYGEKFVFLKF